MDGSQLGGFIRYLRRITDGGAEGTSDGTLLQRFVQQRDESAFAALVDRHGPMVLGVCRRVLRDPHDAEDAFQATFLVLAHKSRSIGRPQAIASWLYSTAQRTALRAKFQRGRRRARESVLDDLPAPETTEDLAWHELRPALDEEVSRLPRKYRDAVVLCYLQEKTYTEAAKVLGLADGTVSSRLARARDLLRKRLLRRGLALSSSLLVALLSQHALSAAVPSALRDATTRAVWKLAAGQAVLAAATTPSVATLTAGVLKAMFLTKLTTIGMVLVLGAVCAGSALVVHARAVGDRQRPAQAEETVAKTPPAAGDKKAKELPDPAERWLKAAQRPGLSAREKAAYEQIAKLHLLAIERPPHLMPPDQTDFLTDGNEPTDVLYRMGLDVLPQLAEALDDVTPTKTATVIRPELLRAGEEGKKRVWLVNEVVARLIVKLAARDFVTDREQEPKFPPDLRDLNLLGIRDLNAQPGTAADFKKAVLDWYAANRKKSLAERKIDDVNDRWFPNRFEAIRWLAENKSAAGRRAIEKRVDAVLEEARNSDDSMIHFELADCALALGKIGDKESLPKVRAVCRYLTDDDRYVGGGAGPAPHRFLEAFLGLALLGEKDEALRELKAIYVKRANLMQAEDVQECLDKARKW
jgi:RNA polymerase sigma factor (sigma-70 family)